MDADWFEMKEIRRRRIADAVWVPLRTIETIIDEGEYGYPGHRKEIFGLGSLAIPLAKRDAAKNLGWSEIGVSNHQGVWATKEFYKPAEIYQFNEKEDLGIELAMSQHLPGDEPSEWHLNQDLVFALGLLREGDSWVRPSEDYLIVARLRRDAEGEPIALEVKNEFLRDYLCARGCFLRLSWYRSRVVIVTDPSEAGSPQEKKERVGDERFELRSFPVLEGGLLPGKFRVLNLWRTDVDPEEDVPVPGPETDDNTDGKSWDGEHKGKQYFRIEGEVWREEGIEPALHSPRVRGDKIPTGISYIIDASGVRMSSEELNDEENARWLWFRPSIVSELMKHRGAGFRWYTGQTGGVSCGPGALTHFGLNDSGLMTVYAYDIAKLDPWQQRVWSGHNVAPEGGVSKELLSAQMRSVIANTQAPERIFEELLGKLDPLFVAATGSPLFRPHAGSLKLLRSISRFRALEPDGIFGLAKDIMRSVADRIDVDPLQRIASPPLKEKWGSLKSLEKYVATLVPAERAHEAMGPLFGAYELRIADAHLPSTELNKSYQLAGVDPKAPPLEQGYSLISNVAKAIWTVGDIVHRHVRSAHTI